MGYRSNIVIAMTKEVYFDFVILKQNHLPSLLGEAFNHYSENNTEYWITSTEIKYYDGINEVDALNKFLNDLEDDNNESCYGFVRTGEDDNDNEYKGNPWDFDIYIERTITTPIGSV